MDIHLIRGCTTILMLVVFSILIIWAFSKKQRKEFLQAEILPFTDKPLEPDDHSVAIKQKKINPSAKGATCE